MTRQALLVGAFGQVGRQLPRYLSQDGWDVAAPARAEFDLTDERAVLESLRTLRPELVINAAALSDVDGCSRAPLLAWKVNAFGPILLAEACRTTGAKLVQLSTDYVFDGGKGRPYLEQDLTHPIQTYGRTKRAAEDGIVDQRDCPITC